MPCLAIRIGKKKKTKKKKKKKTDGITHKLRLFPANDPTAAN
jgi:hypothetical protein